MAPNSSPRLAEILLALRAGHDLAERPIGDLRDAPLRLGKAGHDLAREILRGAQQPEPLVGPVAHRGRMGASEERRHRDLAGGGNGHVQREVMALEAPAPGEAAGRAEHREIVAAGIAEAALLLAQHAFQQAHAVENPQALLVQHRGEQRARRVGLGRLHLAQAETGAAARDVMPVEAVGGVEGDQNLFALAVIEQPEQAAGLIGDALGGVSALGAGAAEGQEGRRGQHEAPRRIVPVMVVLVPVLVRMPAVVRHGTPDQVEVRGYFIVQP
jgi:hypothetical protein